MSSPAMTRPTIAPRGSPRRPAGPRCRSRVEGGAIGCSSMSDRRSWRSLYSSISSLPSSPSASAYVRRKLLTYVGPGSRSHSSFSSARRYLARIFVSDSISEMSILARMRASRRLGPMSGMGAGRLPATPRQSGRDAAPVQLLRGRFRGVRHRRRRGGGLLFALAPRVERGEDAREVGLGHQDLARLGALVARDDAPALEHVDEPPGARVAEPQAALEHRRRGGAHLDDELDRVPEQGILVGVEAVLPRGVLGVLDRSDLLEQVLAQLGLALARPVPGQRRDLRLVDVGALDALQARGADRREEHVP